MLQVDSAAAESAPVLAHDLLGSVGMDITLDRRASAQGRRPTGRWMAVLVAVATFCFALPGFAQDIGRDAVEAALGLTDQRIEQAAQLLAEHPDDRASTELQLARELQTRARAAFSAEQFLIAGRLTRDARLRADRVIAMIRGLPDPDRVETQLERTRHVLERARERLQGCDEPRARALIRVAVEMQSRAEMSHRESRYLAALQLTMSARERAEKALRLCRADESMQEAAHRALRQTDDLLPRVRDAVEDSSSEAAAALLARALSSQSEAWTEFEAGRHAGALRLTQNARLQAQRAMRLASQVRTR